MVTQNDNDYNCSEIYEELYHIDKYIYLYVYVNVRLSVKFWERGIKRQALLYTICYSGSYGVVQEMESNFSLIKHLKRISFT